VGGVDVVGSRVAAARGVVGGHRVVGSRVSVAHRGLGRGVASGVDVGSVAVGFRVASSVDFFRCVNVVFFDLIPSAMMEEINESIN
jgi:hypothetical protein